MFHRSAQCYGVCRLSLHMHCYSYWCKLFVVLAQLTQLLMEIQPVSVSMSVCLSVEMLTRVTQIVAAAHRDLQSCKHRPTNEP